ncbi:interleukin-4 [Apteryx mantelli]|uniref:Interleukin-4 n=1 Tax=Apteryx mantelli TaxID=2696672 RepID=A0ABM4F867_9AVES
MSIKFPVLLTFFCLLACYSHKAALQKSSNFLNENIRMLKNILDMKASCDEMNVTNIFADHKKDDEIEILCKASTVALEGKSCYRQLEGISLNLLHLVRRSSTDFKARCPVAGNTTSLKNFLLDLNRLLQRLAKDNRF